MIIPVAITVGILGALYLAREKSSAPTGPLAPTVPSAPNVNRPPTLLPIAQSAQDLARVSPILWSRYRQLIDQGDAASPFALEQLATEIERAAPGSDAVAALRSLARANRALLQVLQQPNNAPPIQGVPRPTVSYQRSAISYQPSAISYPRPRSASVRCADRAGCTIYRTPARLYPTSVTIPFMTAVHVDGEDGDFLQILHGTTRGWVPKEQFSTDLLPGAPSVVPVQV